MATGKDRKEAEQRLEIKNIGEGTYTFYAFYILFTHQQMFIRKMQRNIMCIQMFTKLHTWAIIM